MFESTVAESLTSRSPYITSIPCWASQLVSVLQLLSYLPLLNSVDKVLKVLKCNAEVSQKEGDQDANRFRGPNSHIADQTQMTGEDWPASGVQAKLFVIVAPFL